jgi:hypothetical protein
MEWQLRNNLSEKERSVQVTLYNEDACGSGGTAPTFMTSAPDGVKWSASRPHSFIPWKMATGIHSIGGGASLETAMTGK